MRAYIIRHGQSENNAKPEHERIPDPGLTEIGHQQAEHLARWMVELKPDRIVSSPFKRAILTAQPSLEKLDCPCEVWQEIHEVGGCYAGHPGSGMHGQPGMSRQQILAMNDRFQIAKGIQEAGWWPHPSRETFDSAVERVKTFSSRLVREHGDSSEVVAFVTHADFNVLFAKEVAPPDESGNSVPRNTSFPAPRNTSVMSVEVSNNSINLLSYDEVAHLPGDLLTV